MKRSYTKFRIMWQVQKGRKSFVRFMRSPGGTHFFLVSAAVGSPQKAWEIAVKLADMLESGHIQEADLMAERAKLVDLT